MLCILGKKFSKSVKIQQYIAGSFFKYLVGLEYMLQRNQRCNTPNLFAFHILTSRTYLLSVVFILFLKLQLLYNRYAMHIYSVCALLYTEAFHLIDRGDFYVFLVIQTVSKL
ncbi:hypothetical protein BY458DRAFT_487835 [Sporodiniella umbellata]|nr:hypothetical protein BY458DRAFT_487835 [Sporodiniella umbellata]